MRTTQAVRDGAGGWRLKARKFKKGEAYFARRLARPMFIVGLLLVFVGLFGGCGVEETSSLPVIHLIRYEWDTWGAPYVIYVESNVDTHTFYGQWSGVRLVYEPAGEYSLRVIGYNPYGEIWVRASIFVDGVLLSRQLSPGGHNVTAEARCRVNP